MTVGWYFPPLCGGTEHGYSDQGIEAFKGIELIDNLAREICQNSLDAKLKDNKEPEGFRDGAVFLQSGLSGHEIKKAVSLSLKDVTNDPWRDVEERFVAGSEIAGTVAKKSRYGYFVDLAEGVTGLLVFSRIVPDKKDSFKEGDEITVIVESVDKENRRISLSYGMRKSEEDKEEVSEFIKKQRKEKPDKRASTEFGAALLAALKKTSD